MISILLPAYNAAPTIEQSIRCIAKQTRGAFECLVLDDGSTDGTGDVVERIQDTRIVCHRLPHRGLTETLNTGLALARYDIIARMDADDLCVPWRLDRQHAALAALPANTILSSWYAVFSDDRIEFCVKPPTTSQAIKKGLLLHSLFSHPGMMCRKDVLVRNGGYCTNVEIDAFQDYETWLTMKDNVEFSIIPEILVFQRYRKESLSNNLVYKERIMYAIQRPYYGDLRRHFGINDRTEENICRGWREYFYGAKSEARRYWRTAGRVIIRHPRVLLAWIVTLLPEPFHVRFKESRIKFRLQYLASYCSKDSRAMRRAFEDLLPERT